jgi:hypothetical protein
MATVDGPAGNLRKRKSNTTLNGTPGKASNGSNGSNGHAGANGASNGQSWITEHGREVDRKLDEHHEWVVRYGYAETR